MNKRILLVALCVVFVAAVPAMALDIEVSGHYFVEHYNNSNETLRESDATNDYTRMEFMAKPVFKINDNITLTTQFTALEHVWGKDADPALTTDNPLTSDVDPSNNFDWKAAYMTIKTKIGGFVIGRYIDTPWGTGLGDSTASHGKNSLHKDRIMYIVPVGNFISGAVAQKNSENDDNLDNSDADYEKYYVFSAYKKETWSTGLLFARYNHKNYVSQKDLRDFQTGYANYTTLSSAATTARGTFSGAYATAVGAGIPQALVQADVHDPLPTLAPFGFPLNLYDLDGNATLAEGQAAAAGAAIAAGPKRSNLGLWVINPYIMGDFGPLGLEAELLYGWGTVELDETRTYQGTTFNELDAEGLAATLDVKYNIGGLTLNAGGTYVQGDSNYNDSETSAIGYFEQSIDLEHGFLLTSDVSELNTTLGGTDENGIPLGNTSGGATTITGPAGYTSFWLGAKYQVLDNLNLGLLYVNSKADDVPTHSSGQKWDDDHGSEYDFTLDWTIMDNLQFNGVVAYLDAGDYWKAGDPTREIENNTTIYGRLILEF